MRSLERARFDAAGPTERPVRAQVALVDPDDEVVCVEPYFDAPKIAADLMGATTIGVPLRADWAETASDWILDLDELDAALNERTKLLVLNTPHNPTGKVFSKAELEGIAKVVQKYVRRADLPLMHRGGGRDADKSAETSRGDGPRRGQVRGDESRRRRGRDADTSAETSRGDAAAATRTSPRRRVAATGRDADKSAETSRLSTSRARPRYPKLVVLSDEVYEGMVFDGLEHQHIATCDGMFERTISVFSVGKTSDRRVEGLPSGVAMAFKRTSISFRRCKNHSARCSYGRDRGRARRFSATGWRVGYAVGPEELIAPLVRVHQASNFATPTPLQIASAIAFDRASAFGYFDDLKASLEGKRDKLCRLLRTAGLSPIVPQGGYFLLADTTKIGIPTDFPLWEAPEDMPLRERRDFAVCRLLCERAGVTAIPASAFFSEGHRHITDSLARFCFCKQDDTLNEAFRRIVHSGLNAAWV